MPVYGFSEDDARRIGHAVRVVERSGPTLRTSGPSSERGGAGVRIMIGQTGTAEWSKASSAVITLYAGPPAAGSAPTNNVGTQVAHNLFADIPGASYVAVSNNGFAWYVIAAECA